MQRPVLKLLVDEDVDVDVVPLLRSRGHLVTEVRSAFGDRSDDRENMALARAQGAILVTCDSRYYLPKRRDSKRAAVLVLKDLHDHQLARIEALVEVIEAEAAKRPTHFFMWIDRHEYHVQR